MKQALLGFIILLCFAGKANAQERTTFKVNPGEKIIDVVPRNELYSYAGFTPGKIHLKNGTLAEALVNYNIYYNNFEFIGPKGDTLEIANEELVKMITVIKDTFYYDKTFVKVIADYGELLLAKKQYFTSNRQNIGAMGTTTASSTDVYNRLSLDHGIAMNLTLQQLLTLRKTEALFIGNKFGYFLPVNKKNLMEMYNNRSKEVSAYLKENSIHLSKEDDLKLLMAYFSK